MEDSFDRSLSSPSVEEPGSFLVISESEDESSEINENLIITVPSSASSGNVSRSETPTRRPLPEKSSLGREGTRGRIRRFISDDSGDEDDSYDQGVYDQDHAESSDRSELGMVTKNNVHSLTTDSEYSESGMVEYNGNTANSNAFKERIERHSTYLSSSDNDANDEDNAESKVAISLAKEEIGVGNIDPLAAQKRALLVFKIEQLQDQLSRSKLLLGAANIELLPDKGEKLRESIALQEKELEDVTAELANTPLMQNANVESHFAQQEVKEESDIQEISYANNFNPYNIDNIPNKPTTSYNTKLGKQAQETLNKELSLTVDSLQDLHGSLVDRPSEETRAEDPQGLKIKLMPHQKHALAWLMWREQQKTPGGVLADDMGLGKTLTMISLILVNVNRKKMNLTEDEDDEKWMDTKPLRHKGGTLVVCPASLLWQWEVEIQKRCKRGTLSVLVYHGNNRENVPKKLAKHDVVITTYNILSREFRMRSTVYKILWDRVILDEAHIIRNHKTQASEAVCGLLAKKRWALSGTPIQNKEMDLYSILKFLKCSPFDDLRVWKRWVDNKNAAGRQRLATLMNSLMLRRTKQELQIKGELESLPEKFVEEISVKLDSQEQLVYEKVLIYSRTLFAQFLSQRAEKDHMFDLAAGKYDKPSFLSNSNKNTQFTKAQNKLLSLHADVKTHEILVLLLRLRQICVHPALIQSMLDEEDMQESGIMETENVDSNLLRQMNSITISSAEGNKENVNEEEIGVDCRVTTNLLTSQNPVFRPDRLSSKMRVVLDKVKEILEKDDKLIIVSQWTSMLEVVATHLPSIKGATFSMFTGNVAIKERQGIMDAFNARNKDPNIMLVSLTAGGVGLNLVGGNHLMLIDIHWNPQLEIQAQDRIYRFGQQKNVYIYKFICKDTIEERIKQLQEKKLELAQSVLSGEKNSATSKLTFNDLKSLFAF